MIAVTQTLLPIGVHAPIFQTRPCAQRKGSSCPTLLREPLGFPVKLLNSRFSVKFYVDSSLSWAVWPAVWKQPWGKERLLETIFVYLFGCTGCWLWLTGPFLASRGLLVDTCGIKFPDQRSNRKWNESHSVVSDSCDPMVYNPPGSSVHGDSPGKNTGESCHFLLQGIFPTQESNPRHCRQILYPLNYEGSP